MEPQDITEKVQDFARFISGCIKVQQEQRAEIRDLNSRNPSPLQIDPFHPPDWYAARAQWANDAQVREEAYGALQKKLYSLFPEVKPETDEKK